MLGTGFRNLKDSLAKQKQLMAKGINNQLYRGRTADIAWFGLNSFCLLLRLI